ncbi:MAG: hypothetical protein HZC54_21450 [Verrucomicrobia bacterium]|nr:hypothetical protein [Verrucomicrobiota bacterium]
MTQIEHLMTVDGVPLVCGLLFIGLGTQMRFFPQSFTARDLSRPENAAFADNARRYSLFFFALGIAAVLLGLFCLFGPKIR